MPDFTELHDFPTESYTFAGASHVRKVRCAWSDRAAVAVALDANVYPYDDTGARVSKIGTEPEGNSIHTDAGDGKISYAHAIVTAYYSTSGPMTADLITEDLTPATGGTKWSHKGLYWSDDGSNALKENEAPERLLPRMNYTLQYHRLWEVPPALLTLGGYINSNTVYTKILSVHFNPFFLLYRYGTVRRVLTAGGVEKFNVKHFFTYAYNDGLGYKGVWRPTAKAYGAIYDVDGNQQFPYPWTSFNL